MPRDVYGTNTDFISEIADFLLYIEFNLGDCRKNHVLLNQFRTRVFAFAKLLISHKAISVKFRSFLNLRFEAVQSSQPSFPAGNEKSPLPHFQLEIENAPDKG